MRLPGNSSAAFESFRPTEWFFRALNDVNRTLSTIHLF
jgi:hypothetical protein